MTWQRVCVASKLSIFYCSFLFCFMLNYLCGGHAFLTPWVGCREHVYGRFSTNVAKLHANANTPHGEAVNIARSISAIIVGSGFVAAINLAQTVGARMTSKTTARCFPGHSMRQSFSGKSDRFSCLAPFFRANDYPSSCEHLVDVDIKNGRLALIGISGCCSEVAWTRSEGKIAMLKAFEHELGVQPPLGFWDPAGYTNDGSMEKYKRRRSVEYKHGRVSMYAFVGYCVPEFFTWDATLSPSLGLKFSIVPNGLRAFKVLPWLGWAQIVIFCGFSEWFNGPEEFKYGEPGQYGKGYMGAGYLGPISDPAIRANKLNIELANGRLAMFAIIGLLVQDGLTGEAWGSWANYTDSPLRSTV